MLTNNHASGLLILSHFRRHRISIRSVQPQLFPLLKITALVFGLCIAATPPHLLIALAFGLPIFDSTLLDRISTRSIVYTCYCEIVRKLNS
jgi:hypothetical protein